MVEQHSRNPTFFFPQFYIYSLSLKVNKDTVSLELQFKQFKSSTSHCLPLPVRDVWYQHRQRCCGAASASPLSTLSLPLIMAITKALLTNEGIQCTEMQDGF